MHHIYSAFGDQKRASDPSELELQMVVCSHENAGTRTWVLSKNWSYSYMLFLSSHWRQFFETRLSPGCPQTSQSSCFSLPSAGGHSILLGVVFKEKPFGAVSFNNQLLWFVWLCLMFRVWKDASAALPEYLQWQFTMNDL